MSTFATLNDHQLSLINGGGLREGIFAFIGGALVFIAGLLASGAILIVAGFCTAVYGIANIIEYFDNK
ncbi:hypothetical protein [Clostridium sp. DL1XJH146]